MIVSTVKKSKGSRHHLNARSRWWAGAGLVSLLFGWFACSESRERAFGRYKVVDIHDGFFGTLCQPYQELYFDKEYLASCGTTQGLDGAKETPDHNCFAIADDGGSAVYWHLASACDGRMGSKAPGKPGGLYHHSPATGEKRLYENLAINQQLTGWSVPGGGLFLGFQGSAVGDGRCNGLLVLGVDGYERVVKSSNPGCP